MDVSIVIPTKNGGERFKEVLKAIENQNTEYEYEIICVDSGSTDNTKDYINDSTAVLHEINSHEFGHGKTRNLGASLGTGEFIVFITQDALPYNDKWLQNFIDAMKLDDEIAGAFGKHYPYPDCNLPDKMMLFNHFANFGNETRIFCLNEENRNQYYADEGYRQYLAFFSDNNSCLRRTIWEKIPYDDVDFAEDQFWARKILEAGYKKAYCPDAAVYHSHNYDLRSYKQRYYDEFKAIYSVYHSQLSHNTSEYIKGILVTTLNECRYIRSQGISKREKIAWAIYSFRRNVYKYSSAKKAVKYFGYSEYKKAKMDKKYSQQLKQIKE